MDTNLLHEHINAPDVQLNLDIPGYLRSSLMLAGELLFYISKSLPGDKITIRIDYEKD